MRSYSETVGEQAAGVSKAEIGGNPTPNSEHSRARAPTPRALNRALSALSPSSVGSCQLWASQLAPFATGASNSKAFAKSAENRQFRWASYFTTGFARLRCVLAKIIPAIGYGGAPPGHRHSAYESCSNLGDILFVLATASVTCAANSTPAAQRLLKPEDFAQVRDVDEPNISTDGNLIAYVVKTADMEKDKLPGNLWLAKWDGSENRALTFGNKGAAIRAGARTANGSRFFPAAKTKMKSISFGFCRSAVAKRRG